MSKDNFTPNTQVFLDIIDNSNKYCVPKYQRDYSWDNQNDEWDLLWEDIVSDIPKHYVGILVFQEKDSEINIIDGQQRLTTLTVIILASLYLLNEIIDTLKTDDEKHQAKERLDILMSKYIGKKGEDLKYYNKITLNINNDAYFRDLCDIKSHGAFLNIPKPFTKDLKTNKKLYNALKFFYEKIKAYILAPTPDKIIDFINNQISKKLIFTTISVNEQENAYMLFETLNSRSVELSAYDLLKNHLLSVSGEKYQKSMLDDLAVINKNIENEDITKFIALDWNSKNVPKTMEKRIYRTISNSIRSTETAFSYMQSLKKSSEIFNIIKNHEFIEDKEAQEYLKLLSYIPRIKQHYMILISLFKSKDKYSIKPVIWALLVIAIRYNYVCQRQANRQEIDYNIIAEKIYKKVYNDSKDILKELRNSDVYVSDEEFTADFSKKKFAVEKFDRYILARIEQYYNPCNIINYDLMTIEHISDKKYEASYCNLIGNQTLLSIDDNGFLQGKSYDDKKEFYKKHSYTIVNSIQEPVWDEEAVNRRSLELANIAKDIFKF